MVALWRGPPSGSFSRCRYKPNGPPPVRSREGPEQRGLSGNSKREQQRVWEADVLQCRMWLLMLLAGLCGGDRGTQSANEGTGTWLLVENPQDPHEYLSMEQVTKECPTGMPSMWKGYMFEQVGGLLGLEKFSGDQGPYGHCKRKPTTWASNRDMTGLTKGDQVQNQSQGRLRGVQSKNLALGQSGRQVSQSS